MTQRIDDRVSVAVDAWLRWVPSWAPGMQRTRVRLCRRCTGSPVVAAAGIGQDVPHQVTHALVSRMQRIIDKEVDAYTARELPTLQAELAGEALWQAGGYQPGAGLEPELDGVDLDPEPEAQDQPFLFTLAGLAEETRPEPPLPRPPLSAEEKQRLRHEIELADAHAENTGRALCLALLEHRPRISAAISRFVEPQIQSMLDELSRHLEPPQ